MQNREFTIDHDGTALHAKLDFPREEKEKYPVLIIVHGYTGDMEETHIRRMADTACGIGFAALRVEMYGHGKSGGSFRDHTVLKWVCELLTVIDYAAALPFAGNIYLAGHSQGGLTVMLAAAMKRDVVRALIPLAPALCIPYDARRGCSFGVSFDPDHVPSEVMMPGERVLDGNYFRTAQLLPVEEAVRSYRGPVLLVHGDADETVPVSFSENAAEMYENALLVTIPGDTHCFDRKLDQAAEAVEAFLLRMEA